MSAGMANPIPDEPPVVERIAVFIPTRFPRLSSNAPPELPAFEGVGFRVHGSRFGVYDCGLRGSNFLAEGDVTV